MKNIFLKTFFLLAFLFPLAGCIDDNKADTQPYEEPEEDLEPTAELEGETPQAPVLFVFSPQNSETVYGTTLTVTGSIYQGTSPFILTATYNDGPAVDVISDIDARSNFSFEISPLVEGANTLVLTVTDAAGSTATQTISFTNLLEEPEASTGGESTGGGSTGEPTGGSGDCAENTDSDLPEFFEDVINFFENLAENLEDMQDFEMTIHESYSNQTDPDGDIFSSTLGAVDLQINSFDNFTQSFLPDFAEEKGWEDFYIQDEDGKNASIDTGTETYTASLKCKYDVSSTLTNIHVMLPFDGDSVSVKLKDNLTFETVWNIPSAVVKADLVDLNIEGQNKWRLLCDAGGAFAYENEAGLEATLTGLSGAFTFQLVYNGEAHDFDVTVISSTLNFTDADIVKATNGKSVGRKQVEFFEGQMKKKLMDVGFIDEQLKASVDFKKLTNSLLSIHGDVGGGDDIPFETYDINHLATLSDEDEGIVKSYWKAELTAHQSNGSCADNLAYDLPTLLLPSYDSPHLGDMTLQVPHYILGNFILDLAKTGNLCWNYQLDLGDVGKLNLDIKPYGELEIKPSGLSNLEIELPFQAKARVKVPVQTTTNSGDCLDRPLQVPVDTLQRSSTPMEDLNDGIEVSGVSNSTLTGKIKLKVSLHNSCSEGLILSLEDVELSNLDGDLEVGDLMLDAETLNTIIQKVMEDAVNQLPSIPLASQVTTIDGMAGWGVEIGDKVEVDDDALYIGINLSEETPECE